MVTPLRPVRRLAPLTLLLLALGAPLAHAQDLVVLPFEGDARGRARAQVSRALAQKKAKLVPLTRYTRAAARKRLRGPAAHSEAAVGRVAPALGLEGVVLGRVEARTLSVRVLDAEGVELWSRELPLRRGVLAAENARRVAAAVVAAAKAPPASRKAQAVAAAPEAPPTRTPEAASARPAELAPTPSVVPAASTRQTPAPVPAVAQVPAAAPRPAPAEAVAAPPPAPRPQAEATVAAAGGQVPSAASAQDVSAWTTPPSASAPSGLAPARLKVSLTGATTWRRYCARPGADSCGAYDARPPEERVGVTLDFNRRFDLLAPYLGGALRVDVQPLAHLESRVLRGLGATFGLDRSYGSTVERAEGSTGEGTDVVVSSTDTQLQARLFWRYHFPMRLLGAEPRLGHVGVRVGGLQRRFLLESQLTPDSNRAHPTVGLEALLPLARRAQVSLGADYFPGAGPGKTFLGGDAAALADEVAQAGASASGKGWGVHLGLTGDLVWRLRYEARYELARYTDTYVGQGSRFGWQDGGVAEESYGSVYWGVSMPLQ